MSSEREFIDYLTDEGGEGATLGDQFREPLAFFASNVDAAHPNEAGVIGSIRFSNVEYPEIYYGDIIVPIANAPNSNYQISGVRTTGVIYGIDIHSSIERPGINNGEILLPLAHIPKEGPTHPGMINGIIGYTNIDSASVIDDSWFINHGTLFYPAVSLANYNVDGVKNELGYICGVSFIYDSTVDYPRVNQGFVEIPVARYYSDVDMRRNGGIIIGISTNSSIDKPLIDDGHIFLPSSGGGLPGIWSQDETLSGTTGVEPANPSGYNVTWEGVKLQTGAANGGVECGTLSFNVSTGSYYSQVLLKMYASLSDDGYLRFSFIQTQT